MNSNILLGEVPLQRKEKIHSSFFPAKKARKKNREFIGNGRKFILYPFTESVSPIYLYDSLTDSIKCEDLQERFFETAWYLECLLIIIIVTMTESVAAKATAPKTMPTTAPVFKLDFEGFENSATTCQKSVNNTHF